MYLNNFDIINKRFFKYKFFVKKCLYICDYKKDIFRFVKGL